MSLTACNNLGLLDQLEKPGTATSGGSKASAIFLFSTANTITGSIRGGMASTRLAADVQCATTRGTLTFPDNACTQVHAVISLPQEPPLNLNDGIADMPARYGVPSDRSINGPNNFVIAGDWFTLVAGMSGKSLADGAVMVGATNWWSFSTLGGNYDGANNCSGGNDGVTGNGIIGNSSTTGNTWLSGGPTSCAATGIKFLCVCY